MKRLLGGVLIAVALLAPAMADAKPSKFSAKITRTKYGVPHIRAKTWQGIGFGFAYAFAEDNICTIADTYVTVSGERSRYFGPDATWKFSGNGAVNKNIDSDFYFSRINASGIVEDLMTRPAPEGPEPELKKVVHGYVAGYNAYLKDTGVNHIPDPRCRGADWVRPITELDVYRRFHQLGSLASSGAAITGIGAAAPAVDVPAAQASQQDAVTALKTAADPAAPGREAEEAGGTSLSDFFPLDIGSNAIGLGSQATRNHSGMVLGNPHFPWDGSERLYQAQATLPGKLDVSGGSLYGVPAVLIGQNKNLAWSHTVASAWRFTPFQLTLVPGDPHSYIVDGQIKAMKPVEMTVKALQPDGSLADVSRTLYETDYGPMFTSILGLPLFPWTPTQGYALGDVNYENFRYLNHFLETDQAKSVKEYDRIQRTIQGIPWVNSIAADRKGNAYYSMDGAIPNVPDSKATQCAGALGLAIFPLTGIPVLDGSRSECGWDTDPDAVIPGIFGPSNIPRLFRRDYVENGNDSHWLSNPEEPLTGYARVIGDEATTRSLRTRLGLTMIQERIAGTDGLKGKKFTLRNLAKVALGNRQYAGELWQDELVAFCQANPVVSSTSGPVDTSAACPVLDDWDGLDNLDSKGAILFRRFVSRLLGNFQSLPTGVSSGSAAGSEEVFDVPFDPADPVNTPRGLNTDNPLVGRALGDAISDLKGAGIPLDGTLRNFQYDTRGGKRIPIHGGPGTLGDFNAINVIWDPKAGYPDVPHGSSFIAAMTWAKHGCPVRQLSFVTYSESENQSSPHSSDYTRAFSKKKWNKVPFCTADIRAQAKSMVRVGR